MNPVDPPKKLRQNRVADFFNRINIPFNLRTQLVVPYVTLTLLVALVGIFIITRLVTSSIRERFVNQMFEANRVAADGIVRVEESHLENLRLMVFTLGVADAILDADQEKLEDLLYPLVLNGGVEALIVTDKNGIEVMSLVKDPISNIYSKTQGTDLAEVDLVVLPLSGFVDEQGDKFSSIELLNEVPYLLTSAPIKDSNSEFVGVMIVGSNLNTITAELKSLALADTSILDESGRLLSTTFLQLQDISNELELTPAEIQNLDQSYSKEINISLREYEIIYSSLVLRQREVGILANALPTNFIVSTEATSRTTLSIIFTAATLAMIGIGYFLAHSISRPILHLRDISLAVASGDFNQRSGLKREDEIGELASSFDTMISHLRQRTSELVQSEKLSAVGQLTAGVVHDVKNPLAVIKGLSEEIQYEVSHDPDLVYQLKVIQDNAGKADEIVSELLRFSRKSEFEMKYQNICDTVNRAIRLTGFLAKTANIFMEVRTDSATIMTSYDALQVEQVLINLVQNAIQAMSDGGKIFVDVKHGTDQVHILVQDDGPGIPPETLEHIFEPFFTTKPEGEGTGLGLSVSKSIIVKHNGQLGVESKIGVGTTFTIKLPITENTSINGQPLTVMREDQ